MNIFNKIYTVFKYKLRYFLGRYPSLYTLSHKYRQDYAERLVNQDTDVCIEGFPRSANSFAVAAFTKEQKNSLKIAHHNHVPAPIIQSCRLGIPTVVLLREPRDTLISLRALQLQSSRRSGEKSPRLAIGYQTHLRSWISFYDVIWSYRSGFVVAPFHMVVDDFGLVMDRINEKYGTSFRRFNHTEENVNSIRTRGYHALPTEERERLKENAREQFRQELNDENHLVKYAGSLYQKYCSSSGF